VAEMKKAGVGTCGRTMQAYETPVRGITTGVSHMVGSILSDVSDLVGSILHEVTPARAGKMRCPYCAERIRSEAVKCRYCGSDLANEPIKSE